MGSGGSKRADHRPGRSCDGGRSERAVVSADSAVAVVAVGDDAAARTTTAKGNGAVRKSKRKVSDATAAGTETSDGRRRRPSTDSSSSLMMESEISANRLAEEAAASTTTTTPESSSEEGEAAAGPRKVSENESSSSSASGDRGRRTRAIRPAARRSELREEEGGDSEETASEMSESVSMSSTSSDGSENSDRNKKKEGEERAGEELMAPEIELVLSNDGSEETQEKKERAGEELDDSTQNNASVPPPPPPPPERPVRRTVVRSPCTLRKCRKALCKRSDKCTAGHCTRHCGQCADTKVEPQRVSAQRQPVPSFSDDEEEPRKRATSDEAARTEPSADAQQNDGAIPDAPPVSAPQVQVHAPELSPRDVRKCRQSPCARADECTKGRCTRQCLMCGHNVRKPPRRKEPQPPRRKKSAVQPRRPSLLHSPQVTRKPDDDSVENDNDDDDEEEMEELHTRVGTEYQATFLPPSDTHERQKRSEAPGADMLWDPLAAGAAQERGEDIDGFINQGEDLDDSMFRMEALHTAEYSVEKAQPIYEQLCQQKEKRKKRRRVVTRICISSDEESQARPRKRQRNKNGQQRKRATLFRSDSVESDLPSDDSSVEFPEDWVCPGQAELRRAKRKIDKVNLKKWYHRFNELVAYKETHGHCSVPTKYTENPQLGFWADKQRQGKKAYDRGEPNYMTEEKIQHLNDIGFEWVKQKSKKYGKDSRQKSEKPVRREKEEKKKKPAREKKKRKNSVRRRGNADPEPVASSVHLSRAAYAPPPAAAAAQYPAPYPYMMHQPPPPYAVAPYQLPQPLDATVAHSSDHARTYRPADRPVVGSWSSSMSLVDRLRPANDWGRMELHRWCRRADELRLYREKFGNCDVPADYPNLGNWVSEQRAAKRNDRLALAQIDILENLGFDWLEDDEQSSVSSEKSSSSDSETPQQQQQQPIPYYYYAPQHHSHPPAYYYQPPSYYPPWHGPTEVDSPEETTSAAVTDEEVQEPHHPHANQVAAPYYPYPPYYYHPPWHGHHATSSETARSQHRQTSTTLVVEPEETTSVPVNAEEVQEEIPAVAIECSA